MSKKRLLLLDGGTGAAAGVRETLGATYEVATVGPRADPMARLERSSFDAVLIAVGDDAWPALGLANRIKKAHPSLVVILLGVPRAAREVDAAFQARVDAIVEPTDGFGLNAALASRLGLPVTAG